MECETIRSGLIDVCFTVSVSIYAASICHACLICVHVEVKIYCYTSDKILSPCVILLQHDFYNFIIATIGRYVLRNENGLIYLFYSRIKLFLNFAPIILNKCFYHLININLAEKKHNYLYQILSKSKV